MAQHGWLCLNSCWLIATLLQPSSVQAVCPVRRKKKEVSLKIGFQSYTRLVSTRSAVRAVNLASPQDWNDSIEEAPLEMHFRGGFYNETWASWVRRSTRSLHISHHVTHSMWFKHHIKQALWNLLYFFPSHTNQLVFIFMCASLIIQTQTFPEAYRSPHDKRQPSYTYLQYEYACFYRFACVHTFFTVVSALNEDWFDHHLLGTAGVFACKCLNSIIQRPKLLLD